MLRRLGLDVAPIHLDLNVATTIDAAIGDIAKSGRTVDALVNNAGVLHEKPLLELTDAEIADSIAVHVTGPIRLIRALAPGMVARVYGRIVNMSSGWGSFAEGLGGPGAYGVTKAALKRHPTTRQRAAVRGQSECNVPRLGAAWHGEKRNAKPRRRSRHCRLAGHPAGRRPHRRFFPRPQADRLVMNNVGLPYTFNFQCWLPRN